MHTKGRRVNPVLVEATRGDARESAHCGAIVVVDADGHRVVALGDVERPVFPRSAVKVLQAIPLVESGAAARLELDDEELAIACASHNGEPEHVAVVARMLAKAGLDESALECGTHWPRVEQVARAIAAAGREATALHNNCSGKHAGFLCLACMLCDGVGLRQYAKGYVMPRHPVMRAVTEALQAATGQDLAQAPRGIDGCSIPTFAIPLHRLAARVRPHRHRHRPSPRPRARGGAAAPGGRAPSVHGRRNRSLRHHGDDDVRRARLLQGRRRRRVLRRLARARPRRCDQDRRRQHRPRRRSRDGGDARGVRRRSTTRRPICSPG